jgi:hypothetical protein
MVAVYIAAPARAKTPLEHLQQQHAPQFREGHSLPPLTRWGWAMPVPVRIELAERWGYALEPNQSSMPEELAELTAQNPEKYPLYLLLPRPLLSAEFRRTLPEEAWCHTAEGKLPDGKKILSPEAPDVVFEMVARQAVAALKRVREKAPIEMILNGGEYGLGVYGFNGKHWKQDPEVVKAKGDRTWLEYISERKTHQEKIIADAVHEALPDLELYIFYHTDGAHANRYGHWWHWVGATVEDWLKVSDLPSSSIYFRHYNSGWTGGNDMLTQALNATGRAIEAGAPLSYNWHCAGWTREKMGEKAFGDLHRYMGYLKCYYTAGQIGGIAGYFSRPKGGFGADFGDVAPHWLRHMIILSRAHALFSHHEEILRNGHLLPGPDNHVWTRSNPAYEFHAGEQDVRVLARRHKDKDEWLITAWAAGGEDREVTVTIPNLGQIALQARDCGTVYRILLDDGDPQLTMLDPNGMRPTLQD